MTGGDWDARLKPGAGNAFDAVRLVLATLVVLEHSFFLIDNSPRRDPLFVASGGQLHCGQLAVFMFFSLSGFLVTRSLIEGSSVPWYLARRVARIVPGFLVATAVGCLLLGPLTAASAAGYFAAQSWVGIVANALALKQVAVTGALAGNPVDLVHGTLWTIRYEFDCYLLLALIGGAGLLRPRLALWTYLAAAAGLAAMALFLDRVPSIDHGPAALLISDPKRWPGLFSFFLAGSAFYVFRRRIPKTPLLLGLCLVGLAATLLLGGLYWAVLLAGTYAILYAALSMSAEPRLFGERIDLSYGVYLYGWPIQQLLLYFTGMGLTPLPLFAAAMALTLPTAFVSWRLVEKPSLRLVRDFERGVPRGAVPESAA